MRKCSLDKINSVFEEIAKNARSSYDTNGEITILDIETLLTSILGESFATGKVYVEQTIIVGKTTGDGGFQM